MNKYYTSLSILLVVLVAKCTNRQTTKLLEFSNKELAPIRAYISKYSKGDTLIFINKFGEADSIEFLDLYEVNQNGTSIFLNVQPERSLSVFIKHINNGQWNGYMGGDEREIEAFQPLITIIKRPSEKKTYYSIQYKNFSNGGDSIFNKVEENITINDRLIDSCFILPILDIFYSKNIVDIDTAYWNYSEGLIGYKSKDGNTWLIRK